MTSKGKSLINTAPALGLVFGAGAGLLLSVLCSFSIPLGITLGAAAGLIVGSAVYALSKRNS